MGSAGSTDSVFGFRLDQRDHLLAFAGYSMPLSGPATGPAQVGFSPDGRFLLVTEKGTSRIDVFPIDNGGYLGAPVIDAAAAPPASSC